MRCKILGIIAVAALLAACGSTPDEVVELKGTGGAQPAPATPPLSAQQAARPPQGAAPGSAQDFITNVGDRVLFDTDKSDVRPDGRATLEKQAAWLKKYPTVKISIEGHCDERGTREYNLALGERRANAVKNYLVALGIPASRVQTISYGKERPAVVGSTDQAWTQNRRGVTVVQ